jgi:hypothetical protein
MAEQGDVPHNDYRAGFMAGFQAIAGTTRTIPPVLAQPATPANMTPFLWGIRRGIQRAGIDLSTGPSGYMPCRRQDSRRQDRP